MTWVITRLCTDRLDLSCVEVCPVSCIVRPVADQAASWPNQLFIDPNECIDCGACEPECPWEAIFEEEFVPPELAPDIAMNAQVVEHRSAFEVPDEPAKSRLPAPEEVADNRLKWGLHR